MNHLTPRAVTIAYLFIVLSAAAGLGPAAAQEDDYLVGDVPEWLEDFGYEDRAGAHSAGSWKNRQLRHGAQ